MAEIRTLQLIDITAPAGEACCDDACCGVPVDPASLGLGPAGPSTAVYGVSGMSCGHCVAAVTAALEALPGVEAVRIELLPGGISTVVVDSREPLAEDAVRAAIEAAGYALA